MSGGEGSGMKITGNAFDPALLQEYGSYSGKAGNADALAGSVYVSPENAQGQLTNLNMGRGVEAEYRDYLAWLDNYNKSNELQKKYVALSTGAPGRSGNIVANQNQTAIAKNYNTPMSGA